MINRLSLLSPLGMVVLFPWALMAEESVIEEARKALRENIAQVAIQKLRPVYARAVGEERKEAALLLAEAFIAEGRHREADAILRDTSIPLPQAELMRARAAASAERWTEAFEAYRAARDAGISSLEAELGMAESAAKGGQLREAGTILEGIIRSGDVSGGVALRLAGIYAELGEAAKAKQLVDSVNTSTPLEEKWSKYLHARIALLDTTSLPSADFARQVFEELLRDPVYLPEELVFGATLGLSQALVRLSGYDKGSQVIESFIRRRPASRHVEAAFKQLDQIYSEQEDPGESELQKWMQRLPPRASALATYYAARLNLRAGKHERTENLLQHFFNTYKDHPLMCDAHLMEADVLLARNQSERAVKALEAAMRHATGTDQRGEIELRTAIVYHTQGEYLLAANLFRSAADRSPGLKSIASYNAALAWLGQRNPEAFSQELAALEGVSSGESLRAELLLEQGLTEARDGQLRAEEILQFFVRQYPRHSRADEARLALAELQFRALQASANPAQRARLSEQANEYLRIANTESRSPDVAAQAAYLAVFLADEDGGGNEPEVIRRGEEFLRTYKGSPLVPDVRMKLGEVYFRMEDYANAETQFAQLVEDEPGSPYAEKALYLAGQSAMRLGMNANALDRALAFFDRVVKRDGSLKLYARQEQAIAQSRSGRQEEAIALYDIILSAQPAPEPEIRFAALCGKGDNLAALGRHNPDFLEKAVAVFDQLAAAPNVTALWRNQALYKKGKTQVQLGRTAAALSAYYDVLEKSAGTDREHFWSSKAGFDAGAILEQQRQWRGAIGIYSKLAALNGPRANEAEARVKQIRLDHFVWD
jgi:TolA-binding protein